MQSVIIVTPVDQIETADQITAALGVGGGSFTLRWPDPDEGAWSYCHFTANPPITVEQTMTALEAGTFNVMTISEQTSGDEYDASMVTVFLSEELWGADHWHVVQEILGGW